MAWTRGHIIGNGSTATVSAATCCRTGEVFAVKTTELSKSGFLQREQKILSSLDSPFIVGYRGYDISMENKKLLFNLMLEYCPDGTISDAIRRKGGPIEEQLIRYYTRRVVEGLEYLHGNGIVHCDIKGANILLDRENGPKIADFGCAKWAGEEKLAGRTGGTPLFMSPEVARGEDQGFPADIWALGCTVIEMATGGSPWPNATNVESLMYKIAFSEESPEIPRNLSDQAKDFLRKCLRRNPKERWTAEQLLNHQFLRIMDSPVLKQRRQEEFSTVSPTCVLDQDIWDSIEEEEEPNSSFPAQRVQLLCCNSAKPSWDWDETWITVRGGDNNNEKLVREFSDTENSGSLTDHNPRDGVKKLERRRKRNSGCDEDSMNLVDGKVSSKVGKTLINRCTEHDQTVVLCHVNFGRLMMNLPNPNHLNKIPVL
ncbi:OLC1v1024808C1 [Oldenlandia corymbosa var. corymbosa]|uniref:OLC1v1024808C1 n=1 Tax=Oldenlandia corymbosa var. corymbosa TaxID=529605 RepID=A0AAV1C3G4_OLDCO|nr:OLC1v1024808C1 [Oldenlandia corymbosa var. corymbosa]